MLARKSTKLSVLLLSLAIAMFPTSPTSSQDLRPAIIGKDDRMRIMEEGPPWDAVGQVNISGYRRLGWCTGTLVAPNLVLTAAHCVMNPWKGKPYPARNVHFLAGLRGSKYKAHEIAKCLRFPEEYEFIPPTKIVPRRPNRVPLRAFLMDIVLIVLRESLPVSPASLAIELSPKPGLRLTHAGYAQDRRYALSAHVGCSLKATELTGPLWYTDCDTHPGSSGGPLFTEVNGQLKLAAIMVGGGGGLNIAVPISQWLSLTENATCP